MANTPDPFSQMVHFYELGLRLRMLRQAEEDRRAGLEIEKQRLELDRKKLEAQALLDEIGVESESVKNVETVRELLSMMDPQKVELAGPPRPETPIGEEDPSLSFTPDTHGSIPITIRGQTVNIPLPGRSATNRALAEQTLAKTGQTLTPEVAAVAERLGLDLGGGVGRIQPQGFMSLLGKLEEPVSLGGVLAGAFPEGGESADPRALNAAVSLRRAAAGKSAPANIMFDALGRVFKPTDDGISIVKGTEGGGFSRHGPVTVDKPTTDELQGYDYVISSLDKIKKEVPNALGPIRGRIESLKLKELGGAGVPPEVRRYFLRIMNLRTDTSFMNGGKQLTGVEYEQFLNNLVNENDTVGTALDKVELQRELVSNKRDAFKRYLDPRKKKALAIDSDVESLMDEYDLDQ
jgi:hypothetical protein